MNASTEQEISSVTNWCFFHEYAIQSVAEVFTVETYVREKSSGSVTENLEDSFPVFQFFQNQQDITDEKMWNNSLLINKKQM